MLHFDCDYMEGAHPKILERLLETNCEQTTGYGFDPFCETAKKKIREACACPGADVFFLVGGTQTNATTIDYFLRPWEGVLAADTGHIASHEAGAIEATGHKILALPQIEGKISVETVAEYLDRLIADPTHDHMPAPAMVYLSQSSEYGTIYTRAELAAMHELCQERGLTLFVDGARLGYALAAPGNDVGLEDLAQFCDAFYIGGTKVGALFGEALVLPKGDSTGRFFTLMKQHGAVMAKGRLLGIQFDTLFTDGLYFEIAGHAIALAEKLRAGFEAKGYQLFIDSPTNQQFVVLSNQQIETLSTQASFGFWERVDENHAVVRFATSWATREEDIDALLALI